MNKNSNGYIITYSVVMVVIVAVLLSVASLSLKNRQEGNVVVEKKSDILGTIGKGSEADKVDDKMKYIEEEYGKYIIDSYGVNVAGDKVEGADAFNLLRNLQAELDKPADQRTLPVFVSRDDNGQTRYIFSVYGSGLWGPIWGYMSMEDDLSTVSGVVFGHKSETPGLGAEIATPIFQDQFKGKTIFKNGELVSISVLKGSGASAGNPNAVDAISGGTVTSRAVESMLKDCLKDYEAFIIKEKAAKTSADLSNVNTQDNE